MLPDIGHSYVCSLADETLKNPFLIDAMLLKTTNTVVKSLQSEQEKAKAIFDFVYERVQYGKKKLYTGYRSSLEVLYSGEGVCGEMAILYITMARCAGLHAQYVSIMRDNHRKKVHHACAGVFLPHLVLADPAYHAYDIKHKDIKVNTDAEVLEKMNAWRT